MKKSKMTKRGKLLLVNIISVVLIIIFALFDYWLVSDNGLYIIIKYFLIQVVITILTLIVYHLSIISGVMAKQNERAEADRKKREEAEKAALERRAKYTQQRRPNDDSQDIE